MIIYAPPGSGKTVTIELMKMSSKTKNFVILDTDDMLKPFWAVTRDKPGVGDQFEYQEIHPMIAKVLHQYKDNNCFIFFIFILL